MKFEKDVDSELVKAELNVSQDSDVCPLVNAFADLLLGAAGAVIYSKNTDSSKFENKGRAIYSMCGLNFHKDITEALEILKKSNGYVWATSHYVVLTNVSL